MACAHVQALTRVGGSKTCAGGSSGHLAKRATGLLSVLGKAIPMASVHANVRPVSPELEQSILAAFGCVAADAIEAPDPSPPVGDKVSLEDLRFALRGLVESAGTIYRAIVRLEREKLSMITVECDCVDAGEAAAVFAMAVREGVERTVAARHEVKPFRSVPGSGFTAAQVAARMSGEQYRDAMLFARRLGVERQDGESCARDLQGSVPRAVLDAVCPSPELLDIADAAPDDDREDDRGEWIPSETELQERIAAVRAAKQAGTKLFF